MSFDYSYGLPNVFWVIYGTIMGFMLLLSLGMYILSALGFYTLAKRRGIPHPGLAWVPIGGQDWILGSLADQYIYAAEGKIQHARRLLLWLNIGQWVVSMGYLAIMLNMTFGGMTGDVAFMPGMLVGFLAGYFILLAAVIVYAVFLYIALHKVYKSCDPKNATMFLVLSIVIGVTQPFFVFFSRKKDWGMPPTEGTQPAPGEGAAQ